MLPGRRDPAPAGYPLSSTPTLVESGHITQINVRKKEFNVIEAGNVA